MHATVGDRFSRYLDVLDLAIHPTVELRNVCWADDERGEFMTFERDHPESDCWSRKFYENRVIQLRMNLARGPALALVVEWLLAGGAAA